MPRWVDKLQTRLLLGVRSTADRGATAVEYGLMAVLIAGVIVAVVIALGEQVLGLFKAVPPF